MSGGRHDHLGFGDPPGAAPVPVGLHRQEDGLGAARGDAAGHLVGNGVPSQQVGGHGHHLGLELGGAGPEVGMERVGLGMEAVHRVEEGDVIGISVIHSSGGVSLPPAALLGVTQRFDIAQDVGTRPSLRRDPHMGRNGDVGAELVGDPIEQAGVFGNRGGVAPEEAGAPP